MNFQIAILFFIVVLVFSFAVYFVVTSMTTRESFDEAKANRRKLMKEYQDQSRQAVDKHKDKKLKKIKKKAKAASAANEKPVDETETLTESDEAPQVSTPQAPVKKQSVKTEPVAQKEVIPESKSDKTTSVTTSVTKKQKSDGVSSKPEVTTSVVDGGAVSSTVQPVKSKNPVAPQSKNNKEKKNEKKVSDQKAQVTPNEVKSGAEIKTDEVVPVAVEKSASVVQIVEAIPKSQVKPKKKKTGITVLQQLNSDKESVNINLLVSLVDKAELSRSEIQYLIDSLLNKQQSDVSEWSKGKQDPQAKLQKQLSETEKLLQEEKQAALGIQAKLKELRNELNKEKASARQYEENMLALQNERKAISSKLQKETEENQTLVKQVEQLQKQLREEQLVVMKIKEEQQITSDQCHDAVGQLAAQHQELQGINTSLREELALLQKNLAIQDVRFQEVNAEHQRLISSSQFENNRLRNEMVALERALGEIRIEYDSLSMNLNDMKVENQTLREQNEQYSKYLNQYNTLVNEVKTEKERNETLNKKLSETWENGYSCNNKQDLLEHDARLEENENLLKTLKTEIDAKNKQIEELNSVQLTSKSEVQKKQLLLDAANSEISALRLKNAELVKKEKESVAADQLMAKDKEVAALKAEIASLKAKHSVEADKIENGNDALMQLKSSLSDKEKEMASLRNELEQTRIRNNELRNKNWKVAEALANAEKSLQSKMMSEQNSSSNNTFDDNKIKSRLQHLITNICPEVVIDDKKKCGSIEEWLDYVEDRVTSTSCASSENDKEKLPTNAENAYLLSLNKRYRNIITETEGILNRLQNDVEVEESRWRLEQMKWKVKVSELEDEVERLKQTQKD